MHLHRVVIVASRSRDSVAEHARMAAHWLESRGAVVTTVTSADIEGAAATVAEQQPDLLVTLGGDGTILAASRLAAPFGIPILGIHMGRFGFIAEAHPEALIEHLQQIEAGQIRIEERIMVHGEVLRDGEPVHGAFGLNDIVISKGAMTRMLHLTTRFGEGPTMDCVADGVIVATPTGSTAYALSAGGPIMAPTVRALLVVPICPHTLAARPVVVPDDLTIIIGVGTDGGEVKFSADSTAVFGLQPGDHVRVTRWRHATRLVAFGAGTFYDKVHDRLLWGERVNA